MLEFVNVELRLAGGLLYLTAIMVLKAMEAEFPGGGPFCEVKQFVLGEILQKFLLG